MARPPPLPTASKNPGLARWLNLAVPGAGLYYLGHRRLGAALALPFLACFLAAFALFLGGYAHYLSVATSDNLLGTNQLERFGDIFPTGWLVALACVGGLLQICSMVLLRRARKTAAARTSLPLPPAKT